MSGREEPKTIPNRDLLGCTYDLVTMDPLNLGSTAKNQNVIDIDVEDGHTVRTRDGLYVVPKGVRHEAPFSMSWETMSTAMSSSYEFQQELKMAVSADAGVEGGFEFSASASSRDMERLTGSRKRTFVYSRAYQEDHILDLSLGDPKAPLAVTPEFRDAVLALPCPDETPDWEKQYEKFLDDWGTHFTKGITLGGLAFQRTSGLATTYLRSTESQRTLESKASIQLEAVKGGASPQAAVATASKTDQEFNLDWGKLDFRGGLGDPSAIDRAWIESLVARPTIVKAKLERLSYLLTPRFFPEQEYINQLQRLLDGAISRWILTRGRSITDTAPLRYGEAVAMIWPSSDGKTGQIGGLFDPAKGSIGIEFPVRNGQPVYPETMKAALRLLSGDGSNKNMAILAGDQVRIEVIEVGLFDREMRLTKNPSDAGRFTVLHHDDNLRSPGRVGEYFQSSDRVAFLPAGANNRCLQVRDPNGQRTLVFQAFGDSPYSAFLLRRCAEREED
jgi:MAC/Perforin domain-containing protein